MLRKRNRGNNNRLNEKHRNAGKGTSICPECIREMDCKFCRHYSFEKRNLSLDKAVKLELLYFKNNPELEWRE